MTVLCGLDSSASKMKLLRGTKTMAKRGAILDLGRHKVLRSQFSPMVIHNEQRPLGLSHSVYYTGQADAMQRDYAAGLKREAQMQALLDLKQRMIDKNLV